MVLRQTTVWVIVRVSLRGSAKIVSIESPLWVFNSSCIPLHVRMFERGEEIWHATIPSRAAEGSSTADRSTPVPVDLVPLANDDHVSWQLSISSSFSRTQQLLSVSIAFPVSFSKKSPRKGLIDTTELVLPTHFVSDAMGSSAKSLVINVCSIRIGDFVDRDGLPLVPEQRMLIFRNTISFMCVVMSISFSCSIIFLF